MVRCAWMRRRGSIIYRFWGTRACPILFMAKSSCAGTRIEASMCSRELRQDHEGTVYYATDGVGLL